MSIDTEIGKREATAPELAVRSIGGDTLARDQAGRLFFLEPLCRVKDRYQLRACA